MIFDPLHYLALLERKTNALDPAAPLAGGELPEEFPPMRRRLEARLSKRGKREYGQGLRWLETFRREEVTRAVQDALRLRAIPFAAVKPLLLCRIEERPPRLDLENYPPWLVAQQCAAEGVAYPRYLLRLSEQELRQRRIPQALFRVVKSLESFDFLAIPSLNKALVLELACGE